LFWRSAIQATRFAALSVRLINGWLTLRR